MLLCLGFLYPTDGSLIITTAGQQTPIRTKSDGPNAINMPTIGEQWRAGERLVDPDITFSRASNKAISSRTKTNGEDIAKSIGKCRGNKSSVGKIHIGKKGILFLLPRSGKKRERPFSLLLDAVPIRWWCRRCAV